MNKWIALLLLPMPSRIKVLVLRMLGQKVHRTARIGFSYLSVKNIILEENTYIGTGNIFTNLNHLEMKEGSRINRWNRFTSGPSYNGYLRLLRRASISLRHYFDVCDLVEIGENTIVAGHHSTFFTHSKGVDVIDYTKPIIIGDWCYLGSNLKVVPGVELGHHCFVGMGSVLVGNLADVSFSLVAGNPAKAKKSLSSDSAYFLQKEIVHPHLK
jgi:acetyltransferase-like isoleucine patch superfamily enzyme